ncbi:nucleoside diphosphate kinase, mitochondrial-like [Pteronotus mesoamericanus]|uniref:nucleoside diphosphate kinase, mitochondrial-like n=1 Tax=Pteronotus mesoamericanus TaxID=1884717 RepID=UPI0023EB4B54|nr:nucleoside diphosphate kinase, mitochondrial-like [Pteronotus parnellii mesoamericanus]
MQCTTALAPESVLAEHYHDLQRKPFYLALISYMNPGPMVAMVWEGPNVVCTSRAMIGHTDSAEAAPGTIRGDFNFRISRNVIHASDSMEEAQREIQLWFQSNELVDWADEGHCSSLYLPSLSLRMSSAAPSTQDQLPQGLKHRAQPCALPTSPRSLLYSPSAPAQVS